MAHPYSQFSRPAVWKATITLSLVAFAGFARAEDKVLVIAGGPKADVVKSFGVVQKSQSESGNNWTKLQTKLDAGPSIYPWFWPGVSSNTLEGVQINNTLKIPADSGRAWIGMGQDSPSGLGGAPTYGSKLVLRASSYGTTFGGTSKELLHETGIPNNVVTVAGRTVSASDKYNSLRIINGTNVILANGESSDPLFLTNGDFTGSASGWTLENGAQYDTDNVAYDDDDQTCSQDTAAIEGERYTVIFEVDVTVPSSALSISLGGTKGIVTTSIGDTRFAEVVCGSEVNAPLTFTSTGTGITLDNVSVHCAPGWYGIGLGEETLPLSGGSRIGTFTGSATGWDLSEGATYSGNAVGTTDGTGSCTTAAPLATDDTLYTVTYTTSGPANGGTDTFSLGEVPSTMVRSTAGTWTEEIRCGSATGGPLEFTFGDSNSDNNGAITIDNVSVKTTAVDTQRNRWSLDRDWCDGEVADVVGYYCPEIVQNFGYGTYIRGLVFSYRVLGADPAIGSACYHILPNLSGKIASGKHKFESCSFGYAQAGILCGLDMSGAFDSASTWTGKGSNHADSLETDHCSFNSCADAILVRNGQSVFHRHSLLLSTTVDGLPASNTSLVLSDGPSVDNSLTGALVIITDMSVSSQKAVGLVKSYDHTTKTLTLVTDPEIFTFADGDQIDVIATGSPAALWLGGSP